MADDVAITGIGCVTPYGRGYQLLCEGVATGRDVIGPISRFDATPYLSNAAGEVPGGLVEEFLTPRLRKRTDRFTHLALLAAHDALVDAGLEVDTNVDGDRVGLSIGNALGGWEFAERELRALWTQGPREVSPYQATAWFPTAAQGNVTIQNAIRGPSRTFTLDRASSAYALIDAIRLLRHGHADAVLAGGTEAPISPYGWLCLQTSGLVARRPTDSDDSVAYHPYDHRHSGSVFGEGAGFLVLERGEFAHSRGAVILGWLSGWGRSTDGYMPYYTVEPSGEIYARAIADALHRAGAGMDSLGVVYSHGSGLPIEDVTELRALSIALGNGAEQVPITVPKPLFGHLLGAAFVLDVILALQSLRTRFVPPVAHFEQPAPGLPPSVSLARLGSSMRAGCTAALVTARGTGGTNAAVVISV